jgi:hypothetical protein
MPLVLTTSLEDRAQGPLQEEFGVVNAMDDPDFAAAVKVHPP